MSLNRALTSFEHRQEQIVERFQIALISTTTAIIYLKKCFNKSPPESGQTLNLEYTDELTGEKISLGTIPANGTTLGKFRKNKVVQIRQSVSELTEDFELYLQDMYEEILEQLWINHKSSGTFVSFARKVRANKDAYCRIG